MHLLQFSTSHYCRKARLALGYKQIAHTVENLTPGLHSFRLKPLTGLTTLPVLLPEEEGQPLAIADSTAIFHYLEAYRPEPSLVLPDAGLQTQAWVMEDWLDESIGTATRFVYYQFRAQEGKGLDDSWSSQLVIQTVRWQYQINAATVDLARKRLALALETLGDRWKTNHHLIGDRLTMVDLTAAALLSPLARIPEYRQAQPWLLERIAEVHRICGEALPPGID